MSNDNPYVVLGVEPTCTQEEITKAFRKKAQQYHPDKLGGNAEMFNELQAAYAKVGTADARSAFDAGAEVLSMDEVRKLLLQSIRAAIQESVTQPVLPRLHSFLLGEVSKNKQRIVQLKKKIKIFSANAKRFTSRQSDAPNLFEEAMLAEIDSAKEALAFHEGNVMRLKKMGEELLAYREGPFVYPIFDDEGEPLRITEGSQGA